MTEQGERLRENVRQVLQRIQDCCKACGRDPRDVRLVAVTKYVDTDTAIALARAIAEVYAESSLSTPVMLGENRPQVLLQRWQQWEWGPAVEWHLIGNLQTNKIKRIAESVTMIHSLDRFDLLDKLQSYAAQQQVAVRGLLEFRISDDEAKHGFVVSAIDELLARWSTWPNLQICGVMGMSSWEATPDQAQQEFEALSAIFHLIGRQLPSLSQNQWHERSMGMSGDLPQAIAAGATMVRIGRALFQGVLD